jgi:cytoplasmic iron level regulating protein YaaA (DUF328/UPF0246 family)
MIYILSPAKNINEDVLGLNQGTTEPRLYEHSEKLLKILQKKSKKSLEKLFDVSEELAGLNHIRYQEWQFQSDKKVAPALRLFNGSVYQNMEVNSMDEDMMDYAQEHFRILSGLYGLLRPKDAIQPYRLEMGTKLKNPRGDNLYQFWGDRITKLLLQDMENQNQKVLVNLASHEYFRAIKRREFPHPIIDVNFKEERNGKFKTFGFNAKMARGKFARFVLEQRIDRVDDLKSFDVDNYSFNVALSSVKELVFTRQ